MGPCKAKPNTDVEQTYFAPKPRHCLLKEDVFAALTLTRWVPDRRAALLHLSGMTARGAVSRSKSVFA